MESEYGRFVENNAGLRSGRNNIYKGKLMSLTQLMARTAPHCKPEYTRQAGFTAVLFILLTTLVAGSAHAYSGMVVFGDSLSDTGNVNISTGGPGVGIPLAPYWNGRFSNGPVWVETLAGHLGLSAAPVLGGGTNFAFGGAPTGLPIPPGSSPSLVDQLATIYFPATGGFADPNALYVIWGGGNDIRAGNPTGAATNIGQMITDLAGAGANHFLIPNLPDIGLTPEAIAAGAAAQAAATGATLFHNAGLHAQVVSLRSTLGVSIIEVDVFGFLNNIISNPGLFGITDTSNPCYTGTTGIGGPGSVCADPDAYVFWDGIHPTANSHELLGDFAFAAIPVPAAVWLFGSALGLLGWLRRRAA